MNLLVFLYLPLKVSPHLSPFLLLKWRLCPSAYQRLILPLCSGFLLPSSIQGLPPFGFLHFYMLHKSLVYWVIPITTGTYSSISHLLDFTFYAPPPTALFLCPCLSKTSLKSFLSVSYFNYILPTPCSETSSINTSEINQMFFCSNLPCFLLP